MSLVTKEYCIAGMGRTSKFQVLSSPSISVTVDYSTSLSFGDRLKDISNKREGTSDGSFFPAAVPDNAAGIAPKLRAIFSIPDFSETDDIEVLECRSQRRLFEEDEYDGRKNGRYNFRKKLQPLQRFNPVQAIPRKRSKEEKQRQRELEDDAGTPLRANQMPSKGSVLDGEDDFQRNATDRPQEQEKGIEGNGENVLEPAGHNKIYDWPQQKMQTCQLYEENKSNFSGCQRKSLFNDHRERAGDDGFDDDLMIIDSVQASSSSPASKRKSRNSHEHDRKEKSIGEDGLEGADELSEYDKPCDWPQQKSLHIDESKLAENDGDEDDDLLIIDSIQASPSFPATEPKQQKRTNKSREPKESRTSKSKEPKVSRTSKSKEPKVSKTGNKIKDPKISSSSGFREPNADNLPKPSKSVFKKMRLQDMLSRINDSLTLQVEPLKEKKLGDVARQMKSAELTNRPVNAEPVEKRPSKPVSANSQEPVYIRPLNSKPVSTPVQQNAVHLEPPKPAWKPETSDRLPSTREQPDAVHMKPPKLVQRPESTSLRASIIRPDNDRESKRTSHLEQYSCGSKSSLRTDVRKSSPLSSRNTYSPIHKAFARDYNDPIWSNLRQDFSLPFAVGRKRKPVQETSNDAGKCKKAASIDMRKEEEQNSYWSSQAPQVKKECSGDPELIAASKAPNLNEFSAKLEEVLKKPFSRSELFEKLSCVRCQKPIVRSRDLRERSISFPTEKDGPSYLDYYPDFAEMLNSASEKEERLKLLRGFLFWIEHACMAGSFQPWIKMRTREMDRVQLD